MACPTDHTSSVALLRRLRAGEHVHYVHHVDVCAAPPEALVADLEPVPGTGLDDDGYSRIWYFYHAKKYNNSRGDTSGHRQRAVTGGGGTRWHSETSPKDVQGSGGGTFCKFSYACKMGSSIERMGWCMAEYDFAAANKQQDDAAAAADASNYVLCKVYRSPRAKGKSASASSSSKKQTAKKRKAGGGDHPEAPPAKLIQQQELQVQQDAPAYYPMPFYQPENVQDVAMQQATPDFNFNIEDINFYMHETFGLRDEPEPGLAEHRHGGDNFNIEDFNVDEYTDILVEMLQDEPEPGLQQPTIAEPEHDGRFIQLPCGPVLAAEATIVGDMLGLETAMKPQAGIESEHEHSGKGLNMEESFTVDWWLLRGEPQQPIVATPPRRAGEFIQMPFVPVVPVAAEATVDDMLWFGPETMYGQWSGGMTTASIPWSSYDAPTSSLYTGCSRLLQGPADPLRLPYLTC